MNIHSSDDSFEHDSDTDILSGLVATGAECLAIAAEAQAVVTYRTLGMLGLWPVADHEHTQMFLEKPAALLQSFDAMLTAGLNGDRPDQMLSAALVPVRERTRDNADRLAAMNPRSEL